MKYFSTVEEKFRTSARPRNILYIQNMTEHSCHPWRGRIKNFSMLYIHILNCSKEHTGTYIKCFDWSLLHYFEGSAYFKLPCNVMNNSTYLLSNLSLSDSYSAFTNVSYLSFKFHRSLSSPLFCFCCCC